MSAGTGRGTEVGIELASFRSKLSPGSFGLRVLAGRFSDGGSTRSETGFGRYSYGITEA